MDSEEAYFQKIIKECERAYQLASTARKMGLDPEKKVAIPIADDLAARVEGLVSIIFPQLINSGIKERIRELEKEYHKNDERVAFIIGREVAEGKFYDFDNKEDAAEAGVRVAVAYLTLGVVTAPLEGIADVRIKKNPDGTEYLAVYYAGPIRSAGGTASALSVVAADYIRIALGLDRYKPEEIEVLRYYTEVEDYYNRVAKKQYHPTKEEIEMIIKNVPVEMTGDPTEKLEVSNYKDLWRVETNRIRGGMCLVLLDGLPLKAEKLLKRIKNYGKEFGLEHWFWLEDFVNLKHKIHGLSKLKSEEEARYIPSTKYLEKIVAGRPILAHPAKPGGFRLRYGRARTCGLAATAFSPATLHLVDFLAIGTQLALEAPGKATVVTVCDELEGPVVCLKDGSIVELRTKEDVEKFRGKISQILSLGDILVPFGEFVSNNHVLLPAAFTEEWWVQEVRQVMKEGKKCSVNVEKYMERPYAPPSLEEAFIISRELDVPLHPFYNFFWHDISKEELKLLVRWFSTGRVENSSLILPLADEKKILEKLCVPCKVMKESVVLEGKGFAAYLSTGGPTQDNVDEIISRIDGSPSVLEALRDLCGIRIMPKGLTRIGAKMGRPEKAERRLMAGRPQILFPCGQQGGKTRNLMQAYKLGYVRAEFPIYFCESCKKDVYYPVCLFCGERTKRVYFCVKCNSRTDKKEHCGMPTRPYTEITAEIKPLIELAARNVGIETLPDMFKGVRGVFGANKTVERLEKGLLRVKYGLYVNKDGTVRYDATDVPLTHFKPKEIGVSVKKLRELGYTTDIHGNELVDENQIVELMPQDIIISDNDDFSAAEYLVNVANFVDELLVKFYKLEPFYNVKTKEDLVGHLVIGLAPHTSAGIVGRIIGFTKAKVCFAHPFWHAAKRRNCLVGVEDVLLYDVKKKRWTVRKIEELENENLNNYLAPAIDENGRIVKRRIREVVKLEAPPKLYRIVTQTGRRITTTPDHRMLVLNNGKVILKRADELRDGDMLLAMNNMNVEDEIHTIDLIDHYSKHPSARNIRVRGAKEKLVDVIKKAGGYASLCRNHNLPFPYKSLWIHVNKDSIPLDMFLMVEKALGIKIDRRKLKISYRKNGATLPALLPLSRELGVLAGIFIADGYARTTKKVASNKFVYQVVWCVDKQDKDVVELIQNTCLKLFGRKPSMMERREVFDLALSGRLYYELFTTILGLGEKVQNKSVVNTLNFPKEFREGLLAGLIHGDGCVEKSVVITTINQSLANEITLIAISLGLYPHLQVENRSTNFTNGEKKSFYRIRFYSDDLPKLSSLLFGRKRKKINKLLGSVELRKKRQKIFGDFRVVKIKHIEIIEDHEERYVYDLVVEGEKNFIAGFGWLATYDCDGDEDSIMLLMDALLNFSRKYLPATRGASTMDAPLVLTVRLNPEEIDDEAWNVDIDDSYPLEFYYDTLEYKMPHELRKRPRIVEDVLKDGIIHMKFTHDTEHIADAPLKTRYVLLKKMEDKINAQLKIAELIRAADENKVAEAVIVNHFLRDIKGNLRTFSRQTVRCVDCNEKYRRVPLAGKCLKCGGKLLLTVPEGAIRKYMEPTKMLIERYRVSNYVIQSFKLLERDVEFLFGKKGKQLSLFSIANGAKT